MYATVEVRWFFEGEIPVPGQRWFTAAADAFTEPPRTDYYLRPLSSDSIGVKLRQGRIECKQRVAPPEPMHFTAASSGVVEQWQKWSFELDETADQDITAAAQQWVAVHKARQSIPLEMAEGAAELARVQIADHVWWTLGFEVHGNGERVVREVLHPAVKGLMANKKRPFTFTQEASYGYPQWLLIHH